MHLACIKHFVDSINNFCEKDVHAQCADGQVKAGYPYLSQCILFLPGISSFINRYAADSQVLCDGNLNVACETGIRYRDPTLLAIFNRNELIIPISVRSIPYYPGLSHVILGYLVFQIGYLDSLTLV